MGRVMLSGGKPDMNVPEYIPRLGNIAEGQIVKINENASPVEFYVAHHNYEPTLNGTGRTLLVRKNVHSKRVWDADNGTLYTESDIDTWLNGTYITYFSENVVNMINTTQFYYTHDTGSLTELRTTSRSFFLLSLAEIFGRKELSNIFDEGEKLNAADVLKFAELDSSGEYVNYWLRTISKRDTNAPNVFLKTSYNDSFMGINGGNEQGIRPCFTLPSTAMVDLDTMSLMEVS